MPSSARSTSEEVAKVPAQTYTTHHPFAYIRPIRYEDEGPVTRFKDANADKIVGDERYQFIILDEDCCIIGLYEKSEQAFIEAHSTSFELHWVQ